MRQNASSKLRLWMGVKLSSCLLAYQSLIRPAHESEQESLPRPNPVKPGVYRNVCNSLPDPTAKGAGLGKGEVLQKGSEPSSESHQPHEAQLRWCKTIDREATLGDASDDVEIFPRLAKKSVEFAQSGDEECLLVLPSDEELHDEEGDEQGEQQRLQRTGTFCHLPSSFV